MTYTSNTADDIQAMLAAIGVADIEDLFADIPATERLSKPPGPERALSEYEALRRMREHAAQNRPAGTHFLSFIGGGAYEHAIPSAVAALAGRGELLTAYTPYQPEASQGTLQIIYEFQSLICALTEMDVANASMYEGATALAEAVLMAVRITGKNQVVLPATLNPAYRAVVASATCHLGIELIEWPATGSAAAHAAGPAANNGNNHANPGGVTDAAVWPAAAHNAAAAIITQPNVWGCLEPARELAREAHTRGALAVAVVNPMSLSVIEPPGAWGADIVAGEAQPLGLPLNDGGPYAGFLATRSAHIRQVPGRLVGRTRDRRGREGFVLTLQTREQHIRRERATSNICTNQGLCATMVTIYLALVGKEGFVRLGEVNLANAARLHDGLCAIPGVEPLDPAPFFNEFTVRLPLEAEVFYDRMRTIGILPGLPASRLFGKIAAPKGFNDPHLLIVCATETKSPIDLDRYLAAAHEILG